MISIFITTRNNSKSLQRALDSIAVNASSCNNIEVVIGHDIDDAETQELLTTYNKGLSITKLGFKWNFSTSVNKDILPFLVERASGQYLWLLSDEAEIQTKNFDSILENAMTSFLQTKRDTLLCVKTNEQSKNANDYKHASMRNRTERNWFKFDYAIFPLITRQVYDTLGYLVPVDLSIHAAKICLAKVLHSSLANRFFNIPEVVVYNHDENAGTEIERFQGIDTYFLQTGSVGVSKLDEVVYSNLASEVNPLSAIVMYMSVTCKVCGSEILIPINTANPNMTICSNCHCRNAIPHLVPDTALSLTMAANDLTDQLMLSSNAKALSAIENNVDNGTNAFKPHISTDPTMMGDAAQDTDDDVSILQREAANYIESSDSNSEKSVLDDYAMQQNDSATSAVSTQSVQDELDPIQQQAVKDMVNNILNQKAISSEKNDSVSSASSILEQSVQDVLMEAKRSQ